MSIISDCLNKRASILSSWFLKHIQMKCLNRPKINWDKIISTTTVNHNTTFSLHCSFINGCEPGDEDQAGCWFLGWMLWEWLLLPRCLTLHYLPVLSEVLSSWVGDASYKHFHPIAYMWTHFSIITWSFLSSSPPVGVQEEFFTSALWACLETWWIKHEGNEDD